MVGFGSLSPYRPRPAYATTVEDSVYVDPQHQGRGVGKALLDELVRLAADHGFHSVVARIVGGHEASIALHAACGFETVGVEREVGRKFAPLARRRRHATHALRRGHASAPGPAGGSRREGTSGRVA